MIENFLYLRRIRSIIWSPIYRKKFYNLANLDNPFMRELMLYAPGTYNHSIIVSSMMQAVAPTIGLNPLKATVCGYYHDIGKVKNPAVFVENCRINTKNKLEKIDPKEACEILIKHLEDGKKIAQENNFPQEVIDAIFRHHGNSLITFYYEKAKRLHGEDKININDYRYKGPKPVSKMSGLTMIADIVEVKIRTLIDPTPTKIHIMTNNLITRIILDGQLDECILTCKDLNAILKVFTKTLTGISQYQIPKDQVNETQEFDKS